MVYVNLPFGGAGDRQEAPVLGFSVHRVQPEPRDGFEQRTAFLQPPFVSEVGALVDMRFDTQKMNWSRMRLGGADLLASKTRLHADGTSEAESAKEPSQAMMLVAVGLIAVGIGLTVRDQTEKNIDSVFNPPK